MFEKKKAREKILQPQLNFHLSDYNFTTFDSTSGMIYCKSYQMLAVMFFFTKT